MIGVQLAVQSAQRFLKELVPAAENVAIEEVELSEDETNWLITLSFFEGPTGPWAERKFKIFRVSTRDGQIKAMKIRTMK